MFKFKRVISFILVVLMTTTTVFGNYQGDPLFEFSQNETLAEDVSIEKGIKIYETVKADTSAGRTATELIVKYKDDRKAGETKSAVLEETNISMFESQKILAKNTELLEISKSSDMQTLIRELEQSPNVEYVQPNYKLYPNALPADANFEEQWGIYNEGQYVNNRQGTVGMDIGAIIDGSLVSMPNQVIVAVIDTGVDASHPDLSGKVLPGYNFVDNNYNTADIDGHGTHIAGTIAAKSDSNGITGIAQNAKILPVKFIEDGYGYTSDAIAAIEYAESQGAKIANISWGSYSYNMALYEAMQESDMLFVCAAGNRGNNIPVFPASYTLPNVISVAAINNAGYLYTYSNYGIFVDVGAPGEDIYSTLPQSEYGLMTGTSAAAPFVAAAAATILSQKLTLTAEELAFVLKTSSTYSENLLGYTDVAGIVNINSGIEYIINNPVIIIENVSQSGNETDMEIELLMYKSANELTVYDIEQICGYMKIGISAFTECISEGFDTIAAINLSQLMAKMEMPLSELCEYFSEYSDEEFLELNKFIGICLSLNVSDSIKQEMKMAYLYGFGASDINRAGVFAGVFDLNLLDIIYVDEEVDINITSLSNIDNDELDRLINIAKAYKVRLSSIISIYIEGDSSSDIMRAIAKFESAAGDRISLFGPVEKEATKDKYPEAPFEFNKNENESININTGAFEYKNTELHLPGKNGLDLSVSAMFDGNTSNVLDTSGYSVWYDDSYYVPVTAYYISYFRYIEQYTHNHATGVRTDYPVIYQEENVLLTIVYSQSEAMAIMRDWDYYESQGGYPYRDGNMEYFKYNARTSYYITRAEEKLVPDWNYNYYNETKSTVISQDRNQLGVGWSFGFSYIEMIDGENYLHLSNGSAYRMKSTFSSTSSNLYKYDLRDISIQSDNGTFTNGQRSSAYVLKHKDGKNEYFASDGRLLGITDRYGNKITFYHTTISSQPVINRIVDTAGREIIFTYSTITGGKRVTVSLPDGSNVKYDLATISGYSGKYQLTKITDMEGRETVFTYESVSARDNYFDKNFTAAANKGFINLRSITYPTGLVSNYTYEKVTSNLGINGVTEYYRAKTHNEVDGSTTFNAETYNYSANNYSGYPANSDPENLPTNFTYSMTITDSLGRQTITTMNNKHVVTSVEIKSGTTLRTSTLSQYNANKLPTRVESRNYNSAGSSYVSTISLYQYDNFGNVTAEWSPLAQGSTANTENKTTYTYHNTYNYPLTVQYKQNQNLTIRQEITPTSSGKDAEWVKVYSIAGGVTTPREALWYSYDGYGNITEERQYYGNLSSLNTFYRTTYSYINNNPLLGTGFNGVYLAEQKMFGVFDADGGIVKTPGTADNTIVNSYTYDWYGNLVVLQDANGNGTSYQYDKLGRMINQTNADNSETTWEYDDVLNTIVHTDEVGTEIKYVYDKFGSIIRSVDVYSNQLLTSYTYDSLRRLSTEINALGATTTYSYDNKNRMASQITAANNATLYTENYTYSDAELVDSVRQNVIHKLVVGETGSSGIITKEYYDYAGRLVRRSNVINGQEKPETYTYDYAGNVVSVKSIFTTENYPSATYTSKWEYDYANRAIKTFNAEGNYSTAEYDALGNLVHEKDFKANALSENYGTTYIYDALGRLIQQISSLNAVDSSVVKYYYDAAGNMLSQKTSSGTTANSSWSISDYSYDNMNWLKLMTSYDEPNEYYTSYDYDTAGRLVTQYTGSETSVPGTESSQISYTYDRLGNMSTYTDALGQTEYYTAYDLMGNILLKTDRNGTVTEYTYDKIGRLLTTSVEDINGEIQTTATEYYSTGYKKSESNDVLTEVFTYNDGQLIGVTDSDGVTKTYTYDAAGNVKSFTLAKDNTVYILDSYTYDNMSRLSTVKDNGALIATYTYDENGNRASLSYPNNSEVYTYNRANMVESVTNKAGNTVISSYAYEYYRDGNQKTKTDHTGKITSYQYDGLGRLLEESETNGNTISYEYDRIGNRSEMVVAGADGYVTSYEYDKANRLKSEETENGEDIAVKEYHYDPNGNTISVVPSNFTQGTTESVEMSDGLEGVTLYGYDGFNRQISVETGDIKVEYQYKADGLRYSKTSGGIETAHIWNGQHIVADEIDGVMSAVYLRGIGLISSKLGANRQYYLYNGHGDVVQLTNTNGTVVKDYDYDAFGVEKSIDENDTNPFRYCGEYYDRETGTIYLRARYYDPAIGRMLSEDSVRAVYITLHNSHTVPDILSLNLYVYCANNPIMFIDPTGHLRWPGEIHSQVSINIKNANNKLGHNFSRERWVDYSAYSFEVGGLHGDIFLSGRLDLVNLDTGEIWEIKPERWNHQNAVDQLNNYVNSTFKNPLLRKVSDAGLKIGGNDSKYKFKDTFKFDIYDVEYWYESDGIINYRFDVNEARLKKEVVDIGAAVLGVLLALLGSQLDTYGTALPPGFAPG